jgi:DedD protein
MSTRSEAPDLAVDELKRRARRRLVGAVVLALTAAVLLPLLLESEPKPLGDDVSIQIPPIDNGKFVNPLSPDKPASPPDKPASPPGKNADAGVKSVPPAGAAAPAPIETPPPAAAAPAPAETSLPADAKPAAPEPAPAAAAPPTTEAKPEPPPAPKTDAKAEPSAKDANAGSNAFVVQVAAFTDRYGALALVRKLKLAGFPCYTEPATTAKGTMHRVRVGPYGSRDAAEAARVKLKGIGYDALVARAQ